MARVNILDFDNRKMSSKTIFVTSNPCFSKYHFFMFPHSFDEEEMMFNSIEQLHAVMRYRVPVFSLVNRDSVQKTLNKIMSCKTGLEVKAYVKSIQPSFREKNSRGPGGHPEWFSIAKDGNVQNQYLFLFDATLAKFQADEESKEKLLATGNDEIYDDEKINHDSVINFGKILMGVRSKLRGN